MFLRCRACPNKLGEMVDGVVVVQHHGRRMVVPEILTVTCERCGTSQTPGGR